MKTNRLIIPDKVAAIFVFALCISDSWTLYYPTNAQIYNS